MPSDFNQPVQISSEYNPFAMFFLSYSLRKWPTFFISVHVYGFIFRSNLLRIYCLDTQVFYFINTIIINR